jgi:hypothetical protein
MKMCGRKHFTGINSKNIEKFRLTITTFYRVNVLIFMAKVIKTFLENWIHKQFLKNKFTENTFKNL